MYNYPDDKRNELSSLDIFLAFFPYINFIVSISYLVRLERRKRNRVVIGDDAFDAAYTIYSKDPELVSEMLNSQEIRKGLFRLCEFTTIELNQDQISLERTGRECEKDYLQLCFNIMSDLADAVERIR